jgi:hypothetical protein
MLTVILLLIITLLIVSLVFAIKYIKYLLERLFLLSQNLTDYNRDLGDLSDVLDRFIDHLKHVNELETYYGDETIQNLVNHSKEIEKYLRDYKKIYINTNDFEEGLNDSSEELKNKGLVLNEEEK